MNQKTLLFVSSISIAALCLIVWVLLPLFSTVGDEMLKTAELTSKILAFSAVAVYAIFKLLSGFHLMNMTLDLAIERMRKSAETDYLAVSVKLMKGDRGAVVLGDVRARIVPATGKACNLELRGVDRLNTGELRKDVPEWVRSERRPNLYLTPGETLTIAGLGEIPSDMPCTVEVIVAGKTPTYWRSGQWRASRTSLPLAVD